MIALGGDAPILAVEASARPFSCAVRVGEREVSAHGEAGAIEEMALVAARLLEEVGARPADLGGIVVGTGPGSFIGVRAAVTFANAMAYAVGCPAVGVSNLDSVAAAVTEPGMRLLVALDAGRGRGYVAGYACAEDGALETVVEPRLVEPEELTALVTEQAPGVTVCGQAALAQREALAQLDGVTLVEAEAAVPSAAAHFRLVERHPARVQAAGPSGVIPHYLAGQVAGAT